MRIHRNPTAIVRALLLCSTTLAAACLDVAEPGERSEFRGAGETADQRFATRMGTAGATKVEIAPMDRPAGSDKPGAWKEADGAKLFEAMQTTAGIGACATDDIKKLATTGSGGLKYRGIGESDVLLEKSADADKGKEKETAGGERGTFGYFVRVTKDSKETEYFVLFSYDRIRYPNKAEKDRDLCAYEVFVFGPVQRKDGKVTCVELVEGLAVNAARVLLKEVPLELANKRFVGAEGAVTPGVADAGKNCLECHRTGGKTAETKPFPWTLAKIIPKNCEGGGGGTDTGGESGSESGGSTGEGTSSASDGGGTTGIDGGTTMDSLGGSDSGGGGDSGGGESGGGSGNSTTGIFGSDTGGGDTAGGDTGGYTSGMTSAGETGVGDTGGYTSGMTGGFTGGSTGGFTSSSTSVGGDTDDDDTGDDTFGTEVDVGSTVVVIDEEPSVLEQLFEEFAR